VIFTNNFESLEQNKTIRDNFKNIRDFTASNFQVEADQKELKEQQDMKNRAERDNFKNIANFTDTFKQ
jgi:hypothetical protein